MKPGTSHTEVSAARASSSGAAVAPGVDTRVGSQTVPLARAQGNANRITAEVPEPPKKPETTPEVVLHTVSIQPDQASVDLVWRATVGYPGTAWLPHMKRLAGWVA